MSIICLVPIAQEINIRRKGKIFTGKIVDSFYSTNATVFLVAYEYKGNKLVAKLPLLISALFYKEGDRIKIVCIPNRNKMTSAFLPGKYGRIFVFLLLYILFTSIMWIIIISFYI